MMLNTQIIDLNRKNLFAEVTYSLHNELLTSKTKTIKYNKNLIHNFFKQSNINKNKKTK